MPSSPPSSPPPPSTDIAPSRSDYTPLPVHDEHDEHHEPSSTWHPPQYLLFILISTITIGSHYGTHSISSLSTEIMNTLDLSRTQYGLLFSSQQIPGIVIPVIGGFLLTYIPLAEASVVLVACIAFSTVLCAIAVSIGSYPLLAVGRFLFGSCNGSLTTLQGAMVARSFRGKIGAGFGAMLFVSRLSSFAGLTLPAYLSAKAGLNFAMWFSVAVCIPPFISTIVYVIIVRTQRREGVRQSEPVRWEWSRLKDVIGGLGTSFWMVAALWVVVAGVVYPTVHYIPDALTERFGLSAVASDLLSGALVLIAGLSSPMLGVLQDKTGHRAAILTGACALLAAGCVIIAFALGITVPSLLIVYIGMGTLAVAFSFAPVTLMSCVAIVTDDMSVPAALGVYKAAENAGLAVIHPTVGAIRDLTGNYVCSFLGLAVLGAVGVWVSLALGGREDGVKGRR